MPGATWRRHYMQSEPLPLQDTKPREALRWLPASKAVRLAHAAGAVALLGASFCAYSRPNKVFDFANLAFCG